MHSKILQDRTVSSSGLSVPHEGSPLRYKGSPERLRRTSPRKNSQHPQRFRHSPSNAAIPTRRPPPAVPAKGPRSATPRGSPSPTRSVLSAGKFSSKQSSPELGKLTPPFRKRGKAWVVLQIAAIGLVLTAVLLTIAITALVARAGRVAVHHSCTSNACQAYASLLRKSKNESISPCRDFYAYVCDNWSKKHTLSVRQEAFERFVSTVVSQASSTPIRSPRQTPVEKAALFYQSCAEVPRTDKGGLERIKRILADANVLWPGRATNPDVVATMLCLAARWMWDSFVHVYWTAIRGTPEISIGPSAYFQRILHHRADMLTRNKYFHYFSLIYDSFRHSNRTALAVYGEITNVENVAAPLFEAAVKSPKVRLTTTVRNFTLTSPQISSQRWFRGFQKYFSKPGFPDPTVVVSNALYMKTISAIVERLGESRLHLYLGWTVVQEMVLLVNGSYIANYYGRREEAESEHKSFCFHLVHQRMGFALESKYVSEVFPPPVQEDVGRIVSRIRSTYHQVLSSNNFPLGNAAVTPQDDFVIQFFNMFLVKSLDETYSNYSTMTNDVVDNYNISAYGSRSTSLKRAVAPPHFGTPHDSEMVALMYGEQEFALAPNSLEIPYYDLALTTSVKYAALGSLVANALTTFLFVDFDHWDAVSKQKLEKTMACLFNNALYAKRGPHGLNPTDWHVLVASTAVGLVWRAFQSAGGGQRKLDTMTPEKTFFVVWCYVLCAVSYPHASYLCNGPLKHSPDFASTFGCGRNSPMNNERVCGLFPS